MPVIAAARPILKWAGGKRQLLPQLRRFYPSTFSRYLEPFAGSAAVFLDLHNSGRLDGKAARLSDVNADVIGCYLMVRDAVEAVIDHLRALERDHLARGSDHFYEVRDERFNAQRRLRPGLAAGYTPELAAMLIYLNRTGYNGLFRVNSLGDFNVPAGRHRSLTICDADNLRRVSTALARPGVVLEIRPFADALAGAGRGDFVYLDPPYAPVSRTAQFTSYTAARFGAGEQASLQRTVLEIAGRGACVLLSNSAAPEIRHLYADSGEARRAGLTARTVRARRAINSRASRRGSVLEYLITNVPPAR
jgi:DNA adenine methylase